MSTPNPQPPKPDQPKQPDRPTEPAKVPDGTGTNPNPTRPVNT